MAEERGAIDVLELRKVLGVFATGVTVLTTIGEDDQPWGFTANSFTSVSLDPPLVLVCVGRHLRAAPVFVNASYFAVNILSAEQRDISVSFGSPSGKRFEAVGYRRGQTGCPIIDKVAAWLECGVHDTLEQGDHVILVGRVLNYSHTRADPLGYCRGAYVTFGLAKEALKTA